MVSTERGKVHLRLSSYAHNTAISSGGKAGCPDYFSDGILENLQGSVGFLPSFLEDALDAGVSTLGSMRAMVLIYRKMAGGNKLFVKNVVFPSPRALLPHRLAARRGASRFPIVAC
jgi:hypothetical protein